MKNKTINNMSDETKTAFIEFISKFIREETSRYTCSDNNSVVSVVIVIEDCVDFFHSVDFSDIEDLIC